MIGLALELVHEGSGLQIEYHGYHCCSLRAVVYANKPMHKLMGKLELRLQFYIGSHVSRPHSWHTASKKSLGFGGAAGVPLYRAICKGWTKKKVALRDGR